MSQRSETGLALLKSHEGEPVKQFIEFDLENRPYRIYTAHFLAKDGDPCGVSLLEYSGAGSTQISKRNEFVGTWNSALMNSTDPNVPDELKE